MNQRGRNRDTNMEGDVLDGEEPVAVPVDPDMKKHLVPPGYVFKSIFPEPTQAPQAGMVYDMRISQERHGLQRAAPIEMQGEGDPREAIAPTLPSEQTSGFKFVRFV